MSLTKTIVFHSLFLCPHLKKKCLFIVQDARGDNQVKDKKLSAKFKTRPHFVKAWKKLGWQFLAHQVCKGLGPRTGILILVTPGEHEAPQYCSAEACEIYLFQSDAPNVRKMFLHRFAF